MNRRNRYSENTPGSFDLYGLTSIENELMAVTGFQLQPSWNRQQFLKALVEATDEMTEDEWEVLSEEAKLWFNDSVEEILNQKAHVPDPRDYVSDEEYEEVKEVDDKPRNISINDVVRKYLANDPNYTTEELRHIIKNDYGFEPDARSIRVVVSYSRQMIQELYKAGKLKEGIAVRY